MRTLLPLVVVGCSYAPARIAPGDGMPPDDVAVVVDMPLPDVPPGTISRAIEVVDTKVTGGPHQDFPVLVVLTDTGLRGTADGGDVVNPSGFDIRFFADAAGTTQLAHEVERYDSNGGRLVAWVKLPTLSAATTFFIRYGEPGIIASQENKAAVWSADYEGVYHFTGVDDSTDQNPGTNSGSSTATGQVLGARGFDGANSTIGVASSATIDNLFAAGGTVEAWVFADTPGEGSLGRVFEKSDTVRMGRCDGAVASSMFFAHDFSTTAGTWCTSTGSAPLAAWIHIAVTYTRTSAANVPIIYLNGAVAAFTAVEAPVGTQQADTGTALVIGDRTGGGRAFDGSIDELRFSRTIRDAGWIATSHENELDPAGFLVLD